MLGIVGTVPDLQFPLIHGKVRWVGSHIKIKDRCIAVNRGTPSLMAAALKAFECIRCPEIYAFLIGDTGRGDGSRRLYQFLVQHLPEFNFQVLTFHYLQPDVDWHNKVLFAVETMQRRPVLIADAGFMYAAKMSGQSECYDFFTPDVGELAFLADDLALIQTVDFFTPILDDPYWFGQIAAANALSDVYAMGGIPKTAMNLVAFPVKQMDLSILRQIIQGGIDKLTEADVVLIGGHSIEDKELKYGLSVTGFVHPARVLAKKNLRPEDRLVLTKPLGTGIVNTAIKAGMASADLTDKVTQLMASLNRDAARIMSNFNIQACTDVTGFGLLGHLAEMVCGSGVSVRIFSDHVPVIPEAFEFAAMGLIPAGAYKNREFRESMIRFAKTVKRSLQDIMVDPQTSGGLLISVGRDQASALVKALQDAGISNIAEIGEVLKDPEEKIWVV